MPVLEISYNQDYAQVLHEVDSDTLTTEVSYTFGNDLLAQDRNGQLQTYHYDGLGSTRLLTDDTGVQTDSYDYEAFGETLNQVGFTENSYLYAGEQFDEDLGQYYLRNRFYNQDIGRFHSMDDWMGNASDPATLHKYAYANVDPVNNIDPSGQFSLGSVVTGLRIASVLASAATVGYDIYQFASGSREFNAQNAGWTFLTLTAGPIASKALKVAQVARAKRILDTAIKSGNIGKLFVRSGRTNSVLLRQFVPSGTKNIFKATNTIHAGFKYRYKIAGIKFEVKWHSPDAVAAVKHPGSNSGSMWTAQIMVNNKLVGTDGKLHKYPSNMTHIPIDL